MAERCGMVFPRRTCARLGLAACRQSRRESPMIGNLKTIVLDAPDIAALSTFYAELAGWSRIYADDEWATLTTDDGWRIGVQYAPDHVPPQWPDAARPQQAHLD